MASDAPEKTAEQTPPAPEVPSEEAPPAQTVPESRLPTRKDVSLREFLNKMDDYAPIVRFSSCSILTN
jgi:transcription initiation factor TFIID subunit 10